MDNQGNRKNVENGHRKIKVLEILGNAITGGMEIQVSNLIRRLSADQFSVICLCPYESKLTAALRESGFQVFITPIRDDPPWQSIEMATEIVRSCQIDLIHAHLLNAHTLGGIAGRLTGKPTLATIHSMKIESQELCVSRLTGTHLLVVCQAAYLQLLALGVSPEKLTLIRNGVDTEIFTPEYDGSKFRKKIGVPADVPLVGFVGRLSWEKGPDKFLKVAERVHSRRPDVHFAMVGEGPMKEEITEMNRRLNCRGNVHIAGGWDNTAEVYPALDVFVQTSRSEGLPLSIMEAMACARPVIALSVGGVIELVEEQSTGRVISPSDWAGVGENSPADWEAIAHRILELLPQPEYLIQMGVNGRKRVEKSFNLQKSVTLTGELFQRLVFQKPLSAANNGKTIKSAKQTI